MVRAVFFQHGKEITSLCADKLGVPAGRNKGEPIQSFKAVYSRTVYAYGKNAKGLGD